jgi:hypothetical protein
LFLPEGIDTGKTIDMCKMHMAEPMCVTSRAFWNYLHNAGEKGAIELDCLATSDRTPLREFGGSDCWKNIGKWRKPDKEHNFTKYRYGNDEWKATGKVAEL